MHTNFVLDNSILFKSACVCVVAVHQSWMCEIKMYYAIWISLPHPPTPHEVCQHTYQLIFISYFTSKVIITKQCFALYSFVIFKSTYLYPAAAIFLLSKFAMNFMSVFPKLILECEIAAQQQNFPQINRMNWQFDAMQKSRYNPMWGDHESETKTVLQASIHKVVSALVCAVLTVNVIGVFTSSPNCFY